ncbi:MAG TPA: TonB family protein [Candidatus Acidoferrum sp.]|nr:TonB family protein [Candidatus Acidoferrum sp.]
MSFLIVGASRAQDQQSSPTSDAVHRDQVHTLVARILKRADKAKCHPNSCTILVTNFTSPSGSTSRLGIQLGDYTSAELIAQGNGIRIVDRSTLQDYLAREHIPSNTLKDREAARWLATELKATAVLLGTIERLGDHFSLSIELLNVSNDKVGPQEAIPITIPEPRQALAPFEPFNTDRPRPAAPAGASSPHRAGVNGVGIPSCTRCPAPQYSNAARKVKFTGTVVLEVTVTEDGRASDISVLKGTPFGLNEAAIRAVNTWTFKPADYEGKSASVRVPIEVTFRLY